MCLSKTQTGYLPSFIVFEDIALLQISVCGCVVVLSVNKVKKKTKEKKMNLY